MFARGWVLAFVYALRDLRLRALHHALRRFCGARVLDLGGRDFYERVGKMGLDFDLWLTADVSDEAIARAGDRRHVFAVMDGCRCGLRDDSFDTVLSIQVLEHVFDPLAMVREIRRVLKPGGHAIFLIPQTSTLHGIPHHYYNFTRYWIQQTMKECDLEIVSLQPLGGFWSTLASRLFLLPFTAFRLSSFSSREYVRGWLFYLLLPLMLLAALAMFPLCLLFSIADLQEEPNNHLVVARKPAISKSSSVSISNERSGGIS